MPSGELPVSCGAQNRVAGAAESEEGEGATFVVTLPNVLVA
jgi:hypothetical protein